LAERRAERVSVGERVGPARLGLLAVVATAAAAVVVLVLALVEVGLCREVEGEEKTGGGGLGRWACIPRGAFLFLSAWEAGSCEAVKGWDAGCSGGAAGGMIVGAATKGNAGVGERAGVPERAAACARVRGGLRTSRSSPFSSVGCSGMSSSSA